MTSQTRQDTKQSGHNFHHILGTKSSIFHSNQLVIDSLYESATDTEQQKIVKDWHSKNISDLIRSVKNLDQSSPRFESNLRTLITSQPVSKFITYEQISEACGGLVKPDRIEDLVLNGVKVPEISDPARATEKDDKDPEKLLLPATVSPDIQNLSKTLTDISNDPNISDSQKQDLAKTVLVRANLELSNAVMVISNSLTAATLEASRGASTAAEMDQSLSIGIKTVSTAAKSLADSLNALGYGKDSGKDRARALTASEE